MLGTISNQEESRESPTNAQVEGHDFLRDDREHLVKVFQNIFCKWV